MEIKKDFSKYWIAGLIFALILGAIQLLISYLGSFIRSTFQPGWMWGLVIGIMGIIILIFVPWIYGRIIEWIYLNFILKEKRKN